MVKAYPWCIGGYKTCPINDDCPYHSYCKIQSRILMVGKAKILRVFGNRLSNIQMVEIKGLNITKKDDDVLKWFK